MTVREIFWLGGGIPPVVGQAYSARPSRFRNSTQPVAAFNGFVRRHGDYLLAWQRMPCSCTLGDLDPHRAAPGCAVCGGSGHAYPLPAEAVRGIFAFVTTARDLVQVGVAAPGDATFTQELRGNTRPLSQYDLVVPLDWQAGEAYEGELVLRGPGPADALHYAVGDMASVRQMDPVTGATVAWQENVHYTVARAPDQYDGSQLTWLPGQGPAGGSVYSVVYRALYAYIAFTPPGPRFERGTELGQQCLLKKRHLVEQYGA